MAPSSRTTVCPEKRLLICCARTRLQPVIAEEILRIIACPLDWDLLLREAAENSVTPLLARHLHPGAAAIPPDATQKLKESARANVARCLSLTAQLITLLDLLRGAGILAIPYKGPVLAAQAYGDLALRQFDDLDIIVRQQDVGKVHGVMDGLGFQTKSLGRVAAGKPHAIPGEYSYRDEARGLIIELHTERTLRHFPVAPDLDSLATRLAVVELSGHEVRTFAPEEGLTFLAVHGSKDLWERISWIVDIAELMRVSPDLDWDRVFRFAQSVNAGRMLHLALILATQLLEAQAPDEVRARIRADGAAEALAREFERRLLNREWVPLAAGRRFDLRRRMLTGKRDGWAYSLRLALAPAQDDWSEVSLPRALMPLYVMLRPLRLLRKYGVMGGRSSRHS